MSDFVIVSAATPDYARQASIFTASWIRNSGAKEIIICPLPDVREHGREYCQVQRNVVVRDVILDAQRRGLRAVMLDIDCWVLGNLGAAFDGLHPLGVARWPLINCGVQFYDTTMDWDFKGFLDKVVARIHLALEASVAGTRVGLVEQKAWEREFHAVGESVNQLDEYTWNMCVDDRRWEFELNKHKDTVQIVHVKGRGERKRQDWRIETALKIFGERIDPNV